MDGGSALIRPGGGLLTTWRRDKAVYAATATGEKMLSATGLHPVVGWSGTEPFYLWQEGARLMWRRGEEATSAVFAEQGAFAAAASASVDGPSVVVWEGTTNGVKTIFARRVE